MTTMEDTLDTIEAMLHQEDKGYVAPAFLGHLPQHTSFGQSVDATARATIAQWCFKIMNICHYSRDTAEIAISCLDRFVATRYGYTALLDRQQYQLAALAAVYTSVKIHEQQALSPELVAKLSNGAFTRQDIESMELRMLKALKWRVNPPTTMDFVRNFMKLIPDNVLDDETRDVVYELVQYQVDRSLIEYEFCTTKASSIALASIYNAVESIFDYDNNNNDGMMMGSYVESLISHYANIDTHLLPQLSEKLYEFIVNHPQVTQILQKAAAAAAAAAAANKASKKNAPVTPPHGFSIDRSFTDSPRSVYMSS